MIPVCTNVLVCLYVYQFVHSATGWVSHTNVVNIRVAEWVQLKRIASTIHEYNTVQCMLMNEI